MIIFRQILPFLCCILYTLADLSTKERIAKQREWLERHAALKNELASGNYTQKSDYYRKIIKFHADHDRPDTIPRGKIYRKSGWSENDIVVPEGIADIEQPTSTTYSTPSLSSSTTTFQTTLTPELDENFSSTTPQSTRRRVFRRRKPTGKPTPTTISTPYTLETITTDDILNSSSSNDSNRETTTVIIRTTPAPVKKNKMHFKWSPWSTWSPCSRTCGGGVKIQSRKCLSKSLDKILTPNNDTSLDCIGLNRRYHICNDKACPMPVVDFREEQCISFNNHVFKGVRYEWEAYIKDDAECELNCKPIGLNYFATLNDTVIDGTSCSKPIDFIKIDEEFNGRAICVEGNCKVSRFYFFLF